MEIKFIETGRYEEDSYEGINYDIVADGVTVGAAGLMIDDEYAYCERIDILEEYRNRGIGTEALYELSRMYGGIVVAPDNEDARRLYERIGSETYAYDYIDQGFGVYEI